MSTAVTTPEQLPFLQEDDSALFLSEGSIRKRYTGEQAEKILSKQKAILMLLASDWPIEVIARELQCNSRTVRALAASSGEQVAGLTKQYARVLAGLSGRWFALAKTKEHEASFLQLVTGAAIATDKAKDLDAMGQGGEENVVTEEVERVQAAAALRRLMDQASDTVDSESEGKATVSETCVVEGGIECGGAGGTGGSEGQTGEGAGGGSGRSVGPISPMDPGTRGLQAKGS